MIKAIYIPQLLQQKVPKVEIKIDETIADLNSLTPVKGVMVVKHGGTYLEVAAKAETIVTLTCDRCLGQYNHRLKIDTSEIIWLESPIDDLLYAQEREIHLEDLSEKLAPDDYFYPTDWLYQQLCLALPLRRLCEGDCQGTPAQSQSEHHIDQRWSGLAALRAQLNQQEQSS